MRPIFFFLLLFPLFAASQLKWQNVDASYAPLPDGVHVYFTEQKMDTAPFRAFYLVADLNKKNLDFTVDTTFQRRLTPSQFYEKNARPVAVVNGTFFSFATNQNLNVVIREGRAISYNIESVKIKKGDTSEMVKVYRSAIGISEKRKADVAWIRNDSSSTYVEASQVPASNEYNTGNKKTKKDNKTSINKNFQPWGMRTAIGGGPVLVQRGEIKISNNFERMFAGKAINDKHPRTAMGYTKNGKLIILMVKGRNPQASGATLVQLAKIMVDLGCEEALNLDGGGSSCLLVNGKETIKPSDKTQRAVPAVFIISSIR